MRGRPCKVEKRSKSIRIRLTDYEYKKLKFISEVNGTNMSDILRGALNKTVKEEHGQDI